MLKMSCLANVAIIFLLCLAIVGCASTQAEGAQEIPEAEGAEGYSGIAGHPGYTLSNSDDAQAAVIAPAGIRRGKDKAGADALPAFYRVGEWNVTRDCFWNISGSPAIYGDPFKWRVLYEANKDGIPDPNNPDLIMPNTILTIPSIDGEYREGTYDSLTDTIDLGEAGALNLNYFNVASAINRYFSFAYLSVSC